MALLINDKFAPRANPGDTNYPNGSIKNESTPGAKDGTPLDADWGNDYAGADAALFAEVGITPSGDADTALNSQRLDALKLLPVNDLSISYDPWKTVAEMQADTTVLPIGKKVFWQGYYTESDGGSNWGIVKSGTHTEDGGSIFTLADGKYVEANLKGKSVNVAKFGAVGDGVTDDRQSIQNAVDVSEGQKLVFDGKLTYSIALTGSTGILIPQPFSSLEIDGRGATIQLQANNLTNYQIIELYKNDNIIINNLNVVGDVESHTGTTGEAGYGFSLRSCTNIIINNCTASKCWGDGMLIAADSISTCKNIHVNYCTFDSNRRQGSSVGGGIDIFYNNCTFKNTGAILATAPAAGIDIEPDSNKMGDVRVYLTNCSFSNNSGGAIHVIISGCLTSPTLESGICEATVKVQGGSSFEDSSYLTTEARGAIRVGGSSSSAGATNKIVGSLSFDSFDIIKPRSQAVWFTNYLIDYPPFRLSNSNISDIYDGVTLGTTLPTTSVYYFDIFSIYEDVIEIGDINILDNTYKSTRGNTFSATATETNHRVKRFVSGLNVREGIDLSRFRFRGFKTDIMPVDYQFAFNSDVSGLDIDSDAIYQDTSASILTSSVGETWGLGIVPKVINTGTQALVIELPSTLGRIGTEQVIDSRRDTPNRLIFRSGTTSGIANSVIYADGTRTSEQFEPAQASGIFKFYCSVEGLWTQI